MILFGFFRLISSSPFGIDPALEKDYQDSIHQENNSFTCLDGSQSIPLSALNDGKCDCPDSSDEPGTNACLNGHFFCHNAGGKSKTIPSHKVNDGYCDCCDGSDEYDNTNAQCPNICSDLVSMAQNSRESIYQKIRAGIRRKKEFIKETQSEFPQAQRELKELRAEVIKFEHEIEILNRKKREKKKLWKLDRLKEKGVTQEQYAEKKRRKEEYIHKPKKQVEVHVEEDPDGLTNIYDEHVNSVDWDVDEQVEELIFHATPRPTPIRRDQLNRNYDDTHGYDERIRHRTDKWKELRKKEKEREVTAKDSLSFVGKARTKVKELSEKIFGSDSKTKQEYDEACKEVDQLNQATTDARVAILTLEGRLGHPLGPENIWYPLSEKEFPFTKEGQDYNMNMLQFIQWRESGSGWYMTYIGEFKGWNATNRTMLYEQGNPCWQGPQRRAEVLLYCGPNNKFLDMEETDRCIYKGHFESPLACDDSYLDWVKSLPDSDLADYVTQWEKVE